MCMNWSFMDLFLVTNGVCLSYSNLLGTKRFVVGKWSLLVICRFLHRYKGEMLEEVPRIFEAVFQCTLEV